jgi:hypothetical protein
VTALERLLARKDARIAELEAERDRLRTWIAEAANATEATVFELLAERDRLRAVVDAVRVMWDNIVDTADEAVMGFPMADYHAIEEALDQLDGSAEATDG